MAKETKEKKVKTVTEGICLACARQGDKSTKKLPSRTLCGSHLQGASKMIAENKAAIAKGEKPVHVSKQAGGKPITWELLEQLKLSGVPQRRSGISDIFLA